MYNNNLIPEKIDNVFLGKYRNEPTKSRYELCHKFESYWGFKGIRSVNITSDNRYLIITFESSEGRICVLDLKKLELLPNEYAGHADSVRMTSIAKDNKSFFTASWDGTSRRFDIDSGKCTQIFNGFGRSPSCFLDPNGKYFFNASYDSECNIKFKNTARCWDIISGNLISIYKHEIEKNYRKSIDIICDGEAVYTGSDDGIAYKWNFRSEKPVLKYFEIEGSVRKVNVSKNYFAAACSNGLVRIYYKFSGLNFKDILIDNMDIFDVYISRDEYKIWCASEDGSIYCFNLITGEMLYHTKLHTYWIWNFCLMNNDKTLVTGSGDGSIAFISTDTGQEMARLLYLPLNNDFLIACPPDKNFPNGFFYTTNKDFIQVIINDEKNLEQRKLDLDDPRREEYIKKLNLKNLVITRLNNNDIYNKLTEHCIQNQKSFKQLNNFELPKLLNL